MTGTGARLDRRVAGTAVPGDVRSGRERSSWAACLTGTLAFSATLGLGCTDVGPTPGIASVTPAAAYSDVVVALAVDAPMLRSGLVVDIGDDDAYYDDSTIHMALLGEGPDLPGSVPLGPVQQLQEVDSPIFLTTIPANLQAGTYGLRVTAPNGRSVTLAGAFQELGPDIIPPLVTVTSPKPMTTLGVGATPATITATVHVDDGYGELAAVTWLASNGASGSCPLPPQALTNAPPAQIDCTAQFQIAPLDPAAGTSIPFVFHVDAVDVANHTGSADVPLSVGDLPSVTSFEPTYGSLAGHQAITIHGEYFSSDAQAYIEINALVGAPPGNRMGGDVVDSNTIFGFTPPNARPHDATVLVHTAAGTTAAPSGFRYTSPPHPRLVQPATGPTAGGIRVTIAGNDLYDGVMISFGPTAAGAIPLYNASYASNDKVAGCLPPALAGGTVSIWANDPITGQGSLMGAFTYSDADDASAMASPDCLPAAAP